MEVSSHSSHSILPLEMSTQKSKEEKWLIQVHWENGARAMTQNWLPGFISSTTFFLWQGHSAHSWVHHGLSSCFTGHPQFLPLLIPDRWQWCPLPWDASAPSLMNHRLMGGHREKLEWVLPSRGAMLEVANQCKIFACLYCLSLTDTCSIFTFHLGCLLFILLPKYLAQK